MWETVEVSVGQAVHRGRYRVQGKQIVLEWRGGRALEWCGYVKPATVAAGALKRLASRTVAA